jgi:peptidoglycan/xylan/chitin deacetylase (PgdA/CDA1 family)
VLNELEKYKAEATFFCIGKNVQRFPETYQKIIDAGHAVGNHTYNHVNGWKTPDKKYIEDVAEAARLIRTNLFRPPYGRLKSKQARQISSAMQVNTKIIMWDVLSADFDSTLSQQQCLSNVIENTTSGSVIVFHDSEKAYRNLEFILPAALKYLSSEGYILKKIQL